MKDEKHILPDDLFRDQLEGMEVPFDNAAWKHMSGLLNETPAKRPVFYWFQKHKKPFILTLITTVMITTIILVAINTLMPDGNTTKGTEIATKNTNSNNGNAIENAAQNELKTTENETTFHAGKLLGNAGNYLAANAGSEAEKTANNFFHYPGEPDKQISGNKTTENTSGNNGNGTTVNTDQTGAQDTNTTGSATDNAVKEAVKADIPKVATGILTGTVKSVKKPGDGKISLKDYHNVDGPFKGGWFGMHFAMQYPQLPLMQDTWRQNAGFNLQFMSHNLSGMRTFGAYFGFDYGMQFTGRGKNYGIILDNTVQDSGFTRLSNFSIDLLFRGHFEYEKYRLKPYVNLVAGPRIFITNQHTEAYHHKTDYENSSSTTAFSSASIMYGAGVGARYRLGKVVSLDARWEWMAGTQTTLVNLDQSSFNGVSTFNLSKFRVKPEYTMFKLGLLFDVGSDEETVHKDETSEETTYYRYDSTTNSYLKVNCNCRQWPVNDTTTEDSVIIIKKSNSSYYPQPSYQPSNSGTNRRGGSVPTPAPKPSGSGRFPGIKPGGGGGKIKS